MPISKKNRHALKVDLQARLLFAPDHDCADLRERYGPTSDSMFGALMREARSAAEDPQADGQLRSQHVRAAEQSSSDAWRQVDEVSDQGRTRLSVDDVEAVYLQAWNDCQWARDKAFNPNRAISNNRWINASLIARNLVLKMRPDKIFSAYRGEEAGLDRFLIILEAEHPDLASQCRDWLASFEASHWRTAPFDDLGGKLLGILRDADLLRPIELGGGNPRCAPSVLVRTVKLRLRWIRSALRVLNAYWDHNLPTALWPALVTWAIGLQPDHQAAVAKALADTKSALAQAS